MKGFYKNIVDATKQNSFFRRVLFTGKYCQLVVMNLKPGEEIGMEAHDTVDQFFRFETGAGKVIIDGEEFAVKDDFVIIVTAGSWHKVINTSQTDDLKLYTIYSPPNHPDGTIHKTKIEAEIYEQEQHKKDTA